MAGGLTPENLSYALLGGVLPPLLWLWFWLKEDRHPEPRKVIISTFLAGMFTVPLAFMLERALSLAAKASGIYQVAGGFIALLFLWALIEEILKYLAAKYTALQNKSFDEPVDALIYMITAALGFAALENIFFLINAFGVNPMSGVMTANLRFMGATLLHMATSGIVGASIGFSFFRKSAGKRNLAIGLLLATLLHFAFNYFIIQNKDGSIFNVFVPLWIFIIAIIFIFEIIKKVKARQT